MLPKSEVCSCPYNKISFQSAYRLLEAVIKTVANYGISVFASSDNQESVETHYRSVIGRYWKRWANISKFYTNRQLLKHLYEDDFLNIQGAKPGNRRPFALFYVPKGCYSPEEPSICIGKLCDNPIFGKLHLLTSNAIQPGTEKGTKCYNSTITHV